MKAIVILLFIVLAAGAFVGEKMVQDPGYVLISYDNTTIETSIWVMLAFSFFAFLIGHWALNLFFKMSLPTKQLGLWRKNRIARTAQKRTFKGLVALSEGNWWQAQRLLSQTAPIAAQPLVNYLGAAQAAHEQGDTQATNRYFEQAREIAPQAEVSIALQEAEVAKDRGNNAQAFTILKRLHSLAPKHTGILRDLADLHQSQQDWSGLIVLLPKLKRLKVMNTEQLSDIESNCYAKMLSTVVEKLPVESTSDAQVKALTKGWKALPGSLNQTPAMIATYARALLAANATDEADKFLRPHIKKSWDDSLIDLYGSIKSTDHFRQYKLVLSWLNKQPNNPALLVCAARMAMFNQEWQEAVGYFEKSLTIKPNADTYRSLSKLLESLGEHHKALDASQKAMELTEDSSPNIPLPELVDNTATPGADSISPKAVTPA